MLAGQPKKALKMLTLNTKTKVKKQGPVITPAPRRGRHGLRGQGGGAWHRIATPRMWLDTNREQAGFYPFITGTNSPRRGAPIGYNLHTGSAVAMDHMSLYRSGAITAPNAMVFGLNGFGKSSISLMLNACLNATGTPLMIFDPIKGEYADYARAAGADIFELGTGHSKSKVNPMDRGPLAAAGLIIGGEIGKSMYEDGVDNVVRNIRALIRINRGRDMTVTDAESMIIKMGVEAVMEREENPNLGHLLKFFDSPTDAVVYASGLEGADKAKFKSKYSQLFESVSALVHGEFSDIFSDKGISLTPGNPAGMCFDSSAIPNADEKMISATMMTTWRLGMDAIDAHWELAQHEARKAAEAAQEGEHYEPTIRWNGFTSLMDEFWYPIRHADGLIQEVDRLSRTNRSKGVGEWKVTHSPKDFLMLANEHDRKIAHSLIEKCGLWVMLAMTEADLEALNSIRRIERTEIDWVTSFMSGNQGLETQDRKLSQRSLAGSPPVGAGKALWKVSDSLGIPVQSPKPKILSQLHQTGQRFNMG